MLKKLIKLSLVFFAVISFDLLLYSPQRIGKESVAGGLSQLFMGTSLPQNVVDEIDSLLELSSYNGTVAVARSGDVLYRGEFGMADFSSKRPISIEDQFQLASVSKQFTAMAVMMLSERGVLKYDDLFVLHVPEFPYPTVTIRHLLNHTSGMPNYMSLLERSWSHESMPDNEDMLRALCKYQPGLYFTPGRRFDYSNTGYALLALLVDRLSGKSFHRFLEEEIFVPLGMWDTFTYSSATHNKGERQLVGHHRFRRHWTQTPETLHEAILGDKGIFSTIEDMLKWDRALYHGSLVSPERLKEAFEPLTLQNGRHWQYGFGFRIENRPTEKMVFHFGRWNSFSTCIFRDLASEYTVVLLSNVKRNLDPIQKKIRALLPQEYPETPLDTLLSTIKFSFISLLERLPFKLI